MQLIQLTTDVTANERAAEKWRRITSEGEALSAVGGEGGQEKEILDDNLYPVSIGFARDICSIGIHGLGAGLFTPLAPVYVGQISDPRSWSVLLRLIDVAVAFATSNRQPPPHAYLHSENHRSCLARHPPRESSLWPMNRSRQWIHLRGWESRMNRLLAGYSPTGLSRFVVQIFFVFFLDWTWSRAVMESFKIDDTWSCSGSDRSGGLPLDNERKTLIFKHGHRALSIRISSLFDSRSLCLKDISLARLFRGSSAENRSRASWEVSGSRYREFI